jgi:hypothetical protein
MTTPRSACASPSCPHRASQYQLACRAHWIQLPPRLRARIGRAARGGQIATLTALSMEVIGLLADQDEGEEHA